MSRSPKEGFVWFGFKETSPDSEQAGQSRDMGNGTEGGSFSGSKKK